MKFLHIIMIIILIITIIIIIIIITIKIISKSVRGYTVFFGLILSGFKI